MYTPAAIGTPLTPNATKVLLLGAGDLAREQSIAFQRFGVEVHAADRVAGAPAHHVANRAHVLDLHDADAVRELIAHVKPHFVIPESEGASPQALADAEAEGLTCVVPTATANLHGANREELRTLASEQLGLPNSTFRFANSTEELRSAAEIVGYPCVVKPVAAVASRGQSFVSTESELDAAWDHAISHSRGRIDRVIVEQYVPFDYEITLLTVRSIDPATGEPATWFCDPIGHRQDRGDCIEAWQPARMTEDALDAARSVAARITNALGGRGVFGVKLFVKGDDVYFCEVSPGPHDTGFVTLGTQRFNQFDLHARAVLGLPIDTTLISPGACVPIFGVDYEGNPDVEYSGLQAAMSQPETSLYLFGKPRSSSKRRMGVAISTAEGIEEARQRANVAAGEIHILPSEG